MNKPLTYVSASVIAALVAVGVWNVLPSGEVQKNTMPANVVVSTENQPQDMATTTTKATSTATATTTPDTPLLHYVEIINGCGPYHNETPCINMRSGPGVDYASVQHLRTGMVLQVEATTTQGSDREWYKVIPDKTIRYPERITSDWYIAVDPESIRAFTDTGDKLLTRDTVVQKGKRIIVDISNEKLTAYDGDTIFMEEPISTGLDDTPTPRGQFTVFKKMPSRYMQGPIPEVSDQFYDLPGVPWNLYFTSGGAVIHGAYWHDHFGSKWSHGCVNLPPQKAKELYEWTELGTTVVVQN